MESLAKQDIFDRQIRLWGAEAQRRCALKSFSPSPNASPHASPPIPLSHSHLSMHPHFRLELARVLVVGLNAVGAEVAKNIVLAGCGTVHLSDETIISQEDISSQFLLRADEVGMKTKAIASLERLKPLNLFGIVDVVHIAGWDADTLRSYSVVVVCGLPRSIEVCLVLVFPFNTTSIALHPCGIVHVRV
jgi:molybdopterin/thiamine biosynthesis adenylyltransferase